MNLDHLPANIEQGVQSYAAEQHISHDEAVLRILETGLSAIKPEIRDSASITLAEVRRAREAARKAKVEVLSKNAPATAEAAFGAFANVPGFRESIDAVISRRTQRYGFSE